MRGALMAALLVAPIVVVAGSPASAAPDRLPVPVSPVGLVDGSCPTFSWSAVAGASGYEVAVLRGGEETAEGTADRPAGEPVLSARLPAGVTVWTPPGTACLASGERYAWSVRALPGDAGAGGPPPPDDGWAEPAPFRVAPAPSRAEVEVALAALRRTLDRRSDRRSDGSPARESGGGDGDAIGAGAFPAGEGTPLASASVPTLGTPSLTVDGNAVLGASGNLFKDGAVFLWDDTAGNTALGRHALASAVGEADGNTALGWEALRYTTEGAGAAEGSSDTGAGFRALKANTTGAGNTGVGSAALYSSTEGDDDTAVGARALFSNTTGYANTAHGAYALYANTTGARNSSSGDLTLEANTSGSRNTAAGPFALQANTTGSGNAAYGVSALQSNTEGSRNVALGLDAGLNATTGDDNVFLATLGEAGDAGAIRIGRSGIQGETFVAGIHGTTTGEDDALGVVVDSAGQLGTVSSSRSVKQDVRDVGKLSRRLLELRPVAFRYREHVARDAEAPVHYGLLAEEVAEVFPELVAEDARGRPWWVKYRLLDPLLLNELQRLERRLDERRLKIRVLEERVAALEGGADRERRRLSWWRAPAQGAAAPREGPE
ncbi:MAG: tail fiber domain-containing protein [Thermoanaerobaculia bacterium]